MSENNLRQIRKRAGLTQADIAERLGKSVPQISRWESGKDNIPSSRLTDLARAYGAEIGAIFGSQGSLQEAGPRLFVKGEVAAGIFQEAWELPQDDWETYTGLVLDSPPGSRFGLRVKGNSMNLLYPPGTILDCVLYTGDKLVEDGKRVIVLRHRTDGRVEATVKELIRDQDGHEWLVPRSTDPKYKSIRADQPDADDVSSIEIVAVVVASIRAE